MDVVSIVASITTLVVLTKEIVIIARNLLRDVQDAPKELVQVSSHVSLISLELECINRAHDPTGLGLHLTLEESLILKKSLTIVKSDMTTLQRDCEKYSKGKTRLSTRMSWALFDSKAVNRCLEQLHKIESHLLLVSNIMHMQGSIRAQHESANQAALVLQELKIYHEEVLRQNKSPHDSSQAAISTTETESSIAFRHRYTYAFTDYWKCVLGSEFRFSKAQNDFQNAYELYARVPWPSYPNKMAVVLSFSIRQLLGLLPNVSVLGGGLNFVNMVPEDSEIVIACDKGDTLAVRDLFRQKKAAPNDMTLQDRALLYYAARSGSVELVRFLINAGAPVQPNQLLAASYWRQPGTARLLLLAGANVEVLAYNGFTAASHLYGSTRPKVPQTEFVEILANNSFSNFNAQDKDGWTALHRAAAWGTSADVRILVQMKASMESRTSMLDWTPDFVAVCYKNLDTLQELWNSHGDANFKDHQDFRGWNLLHMAAGYGNYDAVPFLIERGVSLEATSKATSRSVPYALRGRCVTPNEVARCCGEEAYGKWAQALRIVGREVDVRPEDIDWSVEGVVESLGCCECCNNWNTSIINDD